MSDGTDPRHLPYFRRKSAPNLDEWCSALLLGLIKLGVIKSDVPLMKATEEIKDFGILAIRAARDGHFTEVPQKDIPQKALEAWRRGELGTACGFVCSKPRRMGRDYVGCGSCDPCQELARFAEKESA